MKITGCETHLVNSGLRNYLFVRLTTDRGLTGVGEASLEWQERAVEVLMHDWVKDRILGEDPFDIERIIEHLIRDQYQNGSTIMTAISGVEIALWDLVGKACGQPVYKLLGGRTKDRFPAYANGWYGGCRTPAQYAAAAAQAVKRGYGGLKFDPFGVAHQGLSEIESREAEARVAAVRRRVGKEIKIMIEAHGRFALPAAIAIGRWLEKYDPAWYEEPVTPNSLDLLKEAKNALPFPIAAGERLYTLQDFYRLTAMRAADVVQMDIAHCGGLLMAKKIAGMAQAQDMAASPHCSIGPVALCAAVHFGWATTNVAIQEYFGDFDVPWRDQLVQGWNPIRSGEFLLPDKPGLGLELDLVTLAKHPYRKNTFPSLWDGQWLKNFTAPRK